MNNAQDFLFTGGFILGIIGVIVSAVSSIVSNCKGPLIGGLFVAFGMFLLFGANYYKVANGYWGTGIMPGIYNVEFVYQAGDFVSLGIQYKDLDSKKPYIQPKQFPTSAFVTPIKTDATKLVVKEERGFKTLQLE